MNLNNKKILYINGCSYAAGSDIESDGVWQKTKYNLRWCYAGQLAHKYKLHYVNDALPAGSNRRIFRTTISWIMKYLSEGNNPKDLFVIISWTGNRRYEFYHRGRWVQWHLNTSPNSDEFSRSEFKNLHKYLTVYMSNEYGGAVEKVVQSISLIHFFIKHEIDYIMTNCCHGFTHDIFDKEELWHLERELKRRNYFDMYSSFLERYQHTHKDQFSSDMHPNKFLHTLYTDILDEYIKSIGN